MSDFVKSILDISIFHLSDQTRQRMDEDSRNFLLGRPCTLPFTIRGSSFGWFIDVRNAAERRCAKVPYPSDIVECYDLALKKGCEYILFDRDAERHKDLAWYGEVEQEIWDDPPPPQPQRGSRQYLLNDFAVDLSGMDI